MKRHNKYSIYRKTSFILQIKYGWQMDFLAALWCPLKSHPTDLYHTKQRVPQYIRWLDTEILGPLPNFPSRFSWTLRCSVDNEGVWNRLNTTHNPWDPNRIKTKLRQNIPNKTHSILSYTLLMSVFTAIKQYFLTSEVQRKWRILCVISTLSPIVWPAKKSGLRRWDDRGQGWFQPSRQDFGYNRLISST